MEIMNYATLAARASALSGTVPPLVADLFPWLTRLSGCTGMAVIGGGYPQLGLPSINCVNIEF